MYQTHTKTIPQVTVVSDIEKRILLKGLDILDAFGVSGARECSRNIHRRNYCRQNATCV